MGEKTCQSRYSFANQDDDDGDDDGLGDLHGESSTRNEPDDSTREGDDE